jgi:AAA15 family ATPase/GTPase
MITRIHAENFKSWKDTGDIRLAPLTGLFGANNSGKTSILQMLLLMKQTVESTDRKQVLRIGDDRSLVDLGTFSDLIHGHQPDKALNLTLSWELPKPLVINDLGDQNKELFKIQELSFNTAIREDSGRVIVENFFYEFDECRFGMHRSSTLTPLRELGYRLHCEGYPLPGQNRIQVLPPPVKCYGFPNEVVSYYRNTGFLPDFALGLEDMFSRMIYLGPVRAYPQRVYFWAGESPNGVGIAGEQTVAALLAARSESPDGLQNEMKIINWLKQMKLIHSFLLRPVALDHNYYEIHVKTSEASSEVLATDVGFGISQILPVLVLCYCAPKNSAIILEQPEIHLHPSVQADLADVLIDVVKDKERNIQIILESHSEHLLRRLQRRIAEEVISPDMVALYFCRMENGESKIEELDVDEYGNIRNWPQNFFGDEMGELTAMTEAEMKRKIESSS